MFEPVAPKSSSLQLALLIVIVLGLPLFIFFGPHGVWYGLTPADRGPMALLLTASFILPVLVLGPLIVLGPRRLAYEVRGDVLVVTKMVGTKTIPLAGATVTTTTPKWVVRLFGTAAPGYQSGLFRLDGKNAYVYTSAVRQLGLLIEGPTGRVFVTPANIEGMRAALERAGARLA